MPLFSRLVSVTDITIIAAEEKEIDDDPNFLPWMHQQCLLHARKILDPTHPDYDFPLDHIPNPPSPSVVISHALSIATLQNSIRRASARDRSHLLMPPRITDHVVLSASAHLTIITHWGLCRCRGCITLLVDVRVAAEKWLADIACPYADPTLMDDAPGLVKRGLQASDSDARAKEIVRLVAVAKTCYLDLISFLETRNALQKALLSVLDDFLHIADFPLLRQEVLAQRSLSDDAHAEAAQEMEELLGYIAALRTEKATPYLALTTSLLRTLESYFDSAAFSAQLNAYAVLGALSPWERFGWLGTLEPGHEHWEVYAAWRGMTQDLMVALGAVRRERRLRWGVEVVGREMFGTEWEGLREGRADSGLRLDGEGEGVEELDGEEDEVEEEGEAVEVVVVKEVGEGEEKGKGKAEG